MDQNIHVRVLDTVTARGRVLLSSIVSTASILALRSHFHEAEILAAFGVRPRHRGRRHWVCFRRRLQHLGTCERLVLVVVVTVVNDSVRPFRGEQRGISILFVITVVSLHCPEAVREDGEGNEEVVDRIEARAAPSQRAWVRMNPLLDHHVSRIAGVSVGHAADLFRSGVRGGFMTMAVDGTRPSPAPSPSWGR